MASNDLNKSKNSSLEESLALEAYLRNSIGDLNTSVSKKDRVPLASRIDRELAPFNPDLRSENAIVRGDADHWDFEAGLGPSNYRKSLLPSVLSYFAVAIVCGGVSGGALLYFLLHYSARQQPEVTTALSRPPVPPMNSIGDAGVPQPLAAEKLEEVEPPAKPGSYEPSKIAEEKKDFSKASTSDQQAAVSRQAGPNRGALESSASAGFSSAAVDANAKEPGVGNKTAAIPAPAEAAPMPSIAPGAQDLRDAKPVESEKSDSGATKKDTQLTKLTPDQAEKMLKRASTLLSQNDIAGARLIFQYLANHGSAGGAFALAESYDPKKWAGRRVTGMTPDADLARVWYARAAELGSKEAAAVLRKDKP